MPFKHMQKQHVQQSALFWNFLYRQNIHICKQRQTQNDGLEQSQRTTPCLRGERDDPLSRQHLSYCLRFILKICPTQYEAIYQQGRNILIYKVTQNIITYLLLQSCDQLYTILYSLHSAPELQRQGLCQPVLPPSSLQPLFIFQKSSTMLAQKVEKLEGKKVVLALLGTPVILRSAISNPQ